MKENKDYQLKVRLTQTEREQLQNYAIAHSMTISEAVRRAMYMMFAQQENSK